jgi:transcription elongation factor GreA
MADQIISPDGYEKLNQELEALLSRRKEIAERIERAKEMGDLTENAEYTEAKEAQAFNEGRIAELKTLVKNVTVVQNGHGHGTVSMGSKVTVEMNGEQKKYTIVSFNEVDPLDGKISNESPLGLAFLGKRVGETVKVSTPRGEVDYRILEIE